MAALTLGGLQTGSGYASGMSVEGRVAVVAGASGKLGSVVAPALAAAGARVALLGRRRDALERLAGSFPGGPGRHLVLPVDLVSLEEAETAATLVAERLGPAGIFVHAIGTARYGSGLAEAAEAEWRLLFETNLTTAYHALRAFLPQLEGAGHGRVMTFSTVVAQSPAATNAGYAASKAALEALTVSVGRELREHGGTANVIVLRSILTAEERATGGPKEAAGSATPEEIAAFILWLCSDEGATVNGARIPLHGRG